MTHPRVRVEWFKEEMLTKLEQNSNKRALHRSNAKREFWEAVKRACETEGLGHRNGAMRGMGYPVNFALTEF